MRSIQSHARKPILAELLFSVPVAVGCTHLLLGSTIEGNYLELILQKGYMQRLIPKSMLTLILMLLIKLITRYLDIKKPWQTDMWQRLFLQFFYAILGVLLLDFLISAWYMDLKGSHISDTLYFNFYLPPISIFILLLNGWYTYQNLILQKSISTEPDQEQETERKLKEKEAVIKASQDKIRAYTLEKNIVYIVRSKKFPLAKTIDGKVEQWHQSLENSSPALSEIDFFQVGRSHIVHRSVIAKTKENVKKKKITITLTSPFNEEIALPQSRHMAFRKWWEIA